MTSTKYSEANGRFRKKNSNLTKMDKLELCLAGITAFLAPINAARFAGINITFADITALLCLVIIFANRGVPKRIFGALTEVYFLGLFVFCSSLLLSSIVNGDSVSGLVGVAQYIFAYLILPVVLIRRTHKEAWIIAFAFLAAIVVICLHGIIIIAFDMDVSVRFVSYSGRLRGLVERVNELGGLLAMSVPLVIVLIRTKWYPFYFGWLLLFSILYTIMLTGSNTGMGCFVIAFVGMLLIGDNLLRNLIYLSSIAVVLILFVTILDTGFLPDVFENRVLSAFRTGDIKQLGTLVGRLELVAESIHLAESYLFIGMGFDQYRELSVHGAPVHNIFLLVLNEGGVFALFGFLILLIAIFTQASLVMLRTRSLNAGAFLMVTVIVFSVVISGLPHVYARFLVLPWIVAMGLTRTIPVSRKAKTIQSRFYSGISGRDMKQSRNTLD